MDGPPPLFNQGVSARARLAFFAFLAVALIIIDSRIKALETVRLGVGVVLHPVQQALRRLIIREGTREAIGWPGCGASLRPAGADASAASAQ